jgi:hypothetical protein
MTVLIVECYSGYKANQRPVRFRLGGRTYGIREVEDQWHSPDAVYYRVRADDGNTYVLRRDETADSWSLEAFRAARPGAPETA